MPPVRAFRARRCDAPGVSEVPRHDEVQEVREEALLALAVELPGVRVTRAAVLSRGARHLVLDLALDRPPRQVVARLADPAAAPAVDLARTAAASAMAAAAGVPVPAAVGLRRAAARDEWDCLLMEYAPGDPWSARRLAAGPAAVSAVHEQVRAVLAALRRVHLPSFGELDDDAGTDGCDLLTALHRRAELRIVDPQRRALFDRVLAQEAAQFPDVDGAVLVHDDLHSANVLVTDDEQPTLTAVLDWDKAWAGPADGDLARTAFWDGMPDLEPDGPLKVTERRLVVQQLLWCLEREDDSRRHAADTAELCRRLDVPPLAGTR
jgi:aminoglycoside phosphotransferase (APT) family kinase protein